jgi:hypothetical protein
MELFLNLCWLTLLVPAYLLWQRRIACNRSVRGSLIFVCTLGCVLVLLFPVISASDDLHSFGQAMEESKHSLHADGHATASVQSNAQALAPMACSFSRLRLERIADVVPFSTQSPASFVATHLAPRAPPACSSVSL